MVIQKFKYLLLLVLSFSLVGCGCSKKKLIENIQIITPDVGISGVYYVNEIEHIKIKKGNTLKLKVYITPEGLNNNIKWVVSNPKIINIDKYNNISAEKIGNSKIHLESTDDKNVKSNFLEIEVIE